MASSERVRVEVGFDGGQIMGALVTAPSAEELERAFREDAGRGSERVVSLEAEDGRYDVALGKVVYVKRFARESRVGFGP